MKGLIGFTGISKEEEWRKRTTGEPIPRYDI
jgi:hypothetical protein